MHCSFSPILRNPRGKDMILWTLQCKFCLSEYFSAYCLVIMQAGHAITFSYPRAYCVLWNISPCNLDIFLGIWQTRSDSFHADFICTTLFRITTLFDYASVRVRSLQGSNVANNYTKLTLKQVLKQSATSYNNNITLDLETL